MKRFVYILFCVILVQGAHAQLLDTAEIRNQKVYKSLEEALRHPEEVYVLRLKDRLTKLPEKIFRLTNLNELDISNNRFVDFPAGLERFEYLQILDIERNKIDRIEPDLSLLVNLIELKMGQNKFTTLPRSMGQMRKLEILSVWGTPISDIPVEFKDLLRLRKLDLRVIQFSEDHQARIKEMLPYTHIYFSISCNCSID
ncbi:MAG: leucine-rich repeat domain-containing protein [Flavobacteriales bacterium]|nr:leucine-rich repeat domain-containing protein [Flavobacteriales bacterium]